MRLGRVLVIAAFVIAPVLAPITSSVAQSNVNGSNSTNGSEASSGNATGSNATTSRTGPVSTGGGSNIQQGSNRARVSQTTEVKTGDAQAGQVIGGVVSDGGNLVIDATNRTENSDVSTGDANGTNSATVITGPVSADTIKVAAFAGLAVASNPEANPALLIFLLVPPNVQVGDNVSNVRQAVTAQSGDGMAGQTIGAVVNGGTTDITAANTTRDSDVTTGTADASNRLTAFTGLLTAKGAATFGDPGEYHGVIPLLLLRSSFQHGDNRFNGSQLATATTGNGVAGETIGVASAGNTRVDASNTTAHSGVTTGNATSNNDADGFVGLASAKSFTIARLLLFPSTTFQAGNNTARLAQTADSLSGNGVAGQVAGVSTTAGGSAAVTLANISTMVDAVTGESTFSNSSALFTGLVSTENGAFTLAAAQPAGTEAQPASLADIFQAALS